MQTPIELEEMSEEQLRKLQSFLRSSIGELENEQDWREAEDAELLPLLRGLTRYVEREHLGEDLIDDFNKQHEHDDFDGERDELDF